MLPSAFEVLGPVMVGPSSSHTAGALRIARVAREVAPAPVKSAVFTLYNSFAKTYRGHGTDRALVAGLLGLDTDDPRIKDSFALARTAGLAFAFDISTAGAGLHPNTVDIALTLETGATVTVRGESLGGARVRLTAIDGVAVDIAGDYPTLFVSHADQVGALARITGILSDQAVNIATIHTYRDEKGGRAYTVVETDGPAPAACLAALRALSFVAFVTDVHVPGATHTDPSAALPSDFATGSELLALARARSASIGAVMRERETELQGDPAAPEAAMDRVLAVMRQETTATIEHPVKSLGGLLFSQAAEVAALDAVVAASLMGASQTAGVAGAMATLETSASMGVIVAAPTAGSSGVVPGAVLAAASSAEKSDAAVKEALWCAAAVGALIQTNATVSGAEGGCQAEVGSASAMAAAALVQLFGGTPAQALDAAAIALGNLLGLVCDPAGGLVEYPCQNRNAIGVANAYSAAQLVLSGLISLVPFDEAVQAMKSVGHALPESLRETAQGGLAACPSACSACGLCG